MSKTKEPTTNPDRGEIEDAIEFLERNGVLIRHRGISSVEVLRRALVTIVNPHPRSYPALEADIIGLAIGLPDMGGISSVAHKHGLRPRAVSDRVHKFVTENGLPRSCYMISAKTQKKIKRSARHD